MVLKSSCSLHDYVHLLRIYICGFRVRRKFSFFKIATTTDYKDDDDNGENSIRRESWALFYKTRASFSCITNLKLWVLAWLNVDIESLLMHMRSQTSVTQIYAHNSQSDSVKLFQFSLFSVEPQKTSEFDNKKRSSWI